MVNPLDWGLPGIRGVLVPSDASKRMDRVIDDLDVTRPFDLGDPRTQCAFDWLSVEEVSVKTNDLRGVVAELVSHAVPPASRMIRRPETRLGTRRITCCRSFGTQPSGRMARASSISFGCVTSFDIPTTRTLHPLSVS